MRAVKPRILKNMDEETQTDVDEGVSPRRSKVNAEKDEDTKETGHAVSEEIALDNVMYCEKHPDKKVEYYCRIHGELPCSRCVIDKHRKCQGMSIIEDIATSPRTLRDAYKVSEKLEAAAYQIDTQRQKDKHVLNNLDEAVERINLELKHHKEKIYKITDSIQHRLTKRTDKVFKESNKTVTGHLDLCNDAGAKIEKLKQAMETILATENDSERFIILQKVKKAFHSLITPMHNLHRDAVDVQLNLKMNVDLDKTLEHIAKRMLIEVKSLRRGEPPSKDKAQTEIKKKTVRDSHQDRNTPTSHKPAGKKENPNKFLAQRNFRPYKVRPYTVEKKQPASSQMKSMGSYTSLRKSKPIIVISGEHLSSQAISKRRTMQSSVDSIPEKYDEVNIEGDAMNGDQVKVEPARQSKTIAGQSKATKYTWATHVDKQAVGNPKSVAMDVSGHGNTRYNKSVFKSFERKPLSDEGSAQQSKAYKNSGPSSNVRQGIYRNDKLNDKQLLKQNMFEKMEKSVDDNTKRKTSPKHTDAKIKVPFAGTDNSDTEKNDKYDEKQKGPVASISKSSEHDSTQRMNNKAKVVTSVKRKQDDYIIGFNAKNTAPDKTPKTTASVKVENDLDMKLANPTKDAKITNQSDKTHKEETQDTKNKENVNNKNGHKPDKIVIPNGQVPISVENDKLSNEKANNYKTRKAERQDESENLKGINKTVEGKETNEIITVNQDKEKVTNLEETVNQSNKTMGSNDALTKAFVTDISIDSESKFIVENSPDGLIKTRSADRLRVRTSSSSLLRAKSDK